MKTQLSRKIAPNTTRILYRNNLDMIFLGHVSCYLRNVGGKMVDAFRDFRDTYNVEYEQYENGRCYYLFGEMSKEHREFCRTELKKLKAEQ